MFSLDSLENSKQVKKILIVYVCLIAITTFLLPIPVFLVVKDQIFWVCWVISLIIWFCSSSCLLLIRFRVNLEEKLREKIFSVGLLGISIGFLIHIVFSLIRFSYLTF